MNSSRKTALLALLVCASAVGLTRLQCQESGDLLKGVTFQQSKTEVQKTGQLPLPAQPQQSGSDASLPFSCENISDKEKDLRAACLDSLRENYRYESERLKHRKWVFRFQLIATNVSFVMVITIVSFGIRFAYVQFSREFPKVSNVATSGQSSSSIQSSPSSVTDIEISLARIKVSSSILGVVILGLAMGFFYLYIRFVFPIQGVM
jgi:hypothetical protein